MANSLILNANNFFPTEKEPRAGDITLFIDFNLAFSAANLVWQDWHSTPILPHQVTTRFLLHKLSQWQPTLTTDCLDFQEFVFGIAGATVL